MSVGGVEIWKKKWTVACVGLLLFLQIFSFTSANLFTPFSGFWLFELSWECSMKPIFLSTSMQRSLHSLFWFWNPISMNSSPFVFRITLFFQVSAFRERLPWCPHSTLTLTSCHELTRSPVSSYVHPRNFFLLCIVHSQSHIPATTIVIIRGYLFTSF